KSSTPSATRTNSKGWCGRVTPSSAAIFAAAIRTFAGPGAAEATTATATARAARPAARSCSVVAFGRGRPRAPSCSAAGADLFPHAVAHEGAVPVQVLVGPAAVDGHPARLEVAGKVGAVVELPRRPADTAALHPFGPGLGFVEAQAALDPAVGERGAPLADEQRRSPTQGAVSPFAL